MTDVGDASATWQLSRQRGGLPQPLAVLLASDLDVDDLEVTESHGVPVDGIHLRRGRATLRGVDCTVEVCIESGPSISTVFLAARPDARSELGAFFALPDPDPPSPGTPDPTGVGLSIDRTPGALYVSELSINGPNTTTPLWTFLYSADGDTDASLQRIGTASETTDAATAGITWPTWAADAGVALDDLVDAGTGLSMWGAVSHPLVDDLLTFLGSSSPTSHQSNRFRAFLDHREEASWLRIERLLADDLAIGTASLAAPGISIRAELGTILPRPSRLGFAARLELSATQAIDVDVEFDVWDTIRGTATLTESSSPLADTAGLGLGSEEIDLSIEVEFSRSARALTLIRLRGGVEHLSLLADPFDVTAESASVEIRIEDPTGDRTTTATIHARASVGSNALTMVGTGYLPDGSLRLELSQDPAVTLADLLVDLGADRSAADSLPALSLRDLSIDYHRGSGAVTSRFAVDGIWNLTPSFAVSNLRLAVDHFQSTSVLASATTIFPTAGVSLDLRAAYRSGAWEFIGSTSGDIELGRLLTDLGNAVGTTLVVPDFLTHVVITNLAISFAKSDAGIEFHLACSALLGFDLASGPDADVDPADTPRLELHIDVARDATGNPVAEFGGSITVGPDDEAVDLRLIIVPTSPTVLAVWRDRSGRSLDLTRFLPDELGLPAVTMAVREVTLAWLKADSVSKYLFAFDVEVGAELSADGVPLLSALLPEDAQVTMGVRATGASHRFTVEDISALNDVLERQEHPADPLPYEAELKRGLSLAGRLDIGETPLALELGGSGAAPPDETGDTTQPAPPGDVAPVGPPPELADEISWKVVQRSFGPLHFSRIGLAYDGDDATVRFKVDATVTLAGLRLTLDGLGLRTPLERLAPVFELSGLGIDYSSEAVTVGGAFTRTGNGFSGAAVIATKAFSLSAFGAYEHVGKTASLFVFAVINREFGGPPAFHVTGLAVGFGYNRDFATPTLEQVERHPLLAAIRDDPPPPAEVLRQLGPSVQPKIGAHWLAVGVRFESFRMIRSRAIALVRLGDEVDILLIGLSELTLPKGTPARPYVRVELALRVNIKPADGVALAEALVTANSYVLDPACRLSGGFAFKLWFGNNPHSGDFVLSIGGYHPSFKRPAHYPTVAPLGLSWVNGGLTIKGAAYFALTPSSVMAGGRLAAVYRSGAITASFLLQAHFLISWKPFFYDIRIGISIGVEFVAHTLFGTITIRATLGASAHVWGPEFAGRARVYWGALSFDVDFGAIERGPSRPRTLTWDEFRTSFLPAREGVCEIQIASGFVADTDMLARELEDAEKSALADQIRATGRNDWIVRADELAFSTRSAIPATEVVLIGAEDSENVVPGLGGDTKLGVQSMGDGAIVSIHRIAVRRIDQSGPGASLDLLRHWTSAGAARQGVPIQMWSDTVVPRAPSADVLANRIVGVGALAPTPRPSDNATEPLDLRMFEFRRVRPDKVMALTPGDALRQQPGPNLDDGATIFTKISDTVGDASVSSLRDAVVDRVRALGFLPDDVATPVRQTVLAREIGDVFKSSPMLGTPRLGGPTTATAVEAPVDRPPPIDLSVPPELVRLVARLIAEIRTHVYVTADGESDQHGVASIAPSATPRSSGGRGDAESDASNLLVLSENAAGDDRRELSRSLRAGHGVVFDVALTGTDSLPIKEIGSRRIPARLELDDEPAVSARVIELDRYGGVVHDDEATGAVELDPDTSRVVVLAGAMTSADTPPSGWRATSVMLRVAPRIFVVDGGVVEVQSDPAQDVTALRGGEVVRGNTVTRHDPTVTEASTSHRPGWVRTRFPSSTETVAIFLRRIAGGVGAEGNRRVGVTVSGSGGREFRLVPRHVVHESNDEVALLFRVPHDVHSTTPSDVDVRVQPDAAGWSLSGVVGYAEQPIAVRRNWGAASTRLRAPAVASTATRNVRLVRGAAA